MGDHVVLFVDRLVRPMPVEPLTQHPAEPAPEPLPPVIETPAGPSGSLPENYDDDDEDGEDEPLLQMAECRICQDDDSINNLENPCACSGSLKVHFSFLLIFVLVMVIENS
jgi:hypothetical protein